MKRRTTVLMSGFIVAAVLLGVGVLAALAAGMLGHGLDEGSPGSGTPMSGYGSTGMLGASGPGGVTRSSPYSGAWGACYPSGMVAGATATTPRGKTLTLTQARQQVRHYVAQYGSTTLAIDEVMEFQKNFYAIVKDTSTGHGAFEVLVNKSTGAVFSEYGPAMMWNTRYGIMHGMMGYQPSSGPMTIAPTQATGIATQWLQQNQAGTTTEAPEQFPGYYTVHILKHGKVTGMLSVNGFTGQVWYHTWHGALIQMKDLHA